MQRVGLGCWGSVSVGSSGLASIRMRALRPLPITAAHRVGAECDAFMFCVCVCLCSGGTMMRDWQTISRMPTVTDATPDIPFRGNGSVVSTMPASTGPQDTNPPPPPLSRDHGSDGTSSDGCVELCKQTKWEDVLRLNFSV